MSEWIYCKDKQPDHSCWCLATLIFDGCKRIEIVYFFLKEMNWTYHEYDEFYYFNAKGDGGDDSRLIAWMPLPEPAK